jgi:glycosyltransferase involved in cell wall biosynthesis
MNFHILSVPEHPVRKEITTCGFTGLTYRMAVMLKEAGHHVTIYGVPTPDCPHDEFVETVSISTYRRFWKERSKDQHQTCHGGHNIAHTQFIERGAVKLAKRYKKGDLILNFFGAAHAWANKISPFVIEPSIGYLHAASPFRIYGSSGWMHYCYGEEKLSVKPRMFDAVIPHYLDMRDWELNPDQKRGDHLLFLGRLGAGKGEIILDDLAERTGRQIRVYGQQPASPAPSVKFKNPLVEYGGILNHEERKVAMQSVAALIAPSLYVEPCALVALEALSSGTPVISTDFGGFREVVTADVGFRCRMLREFVHAVENIHTIDNATCRKVAEQRYSLEAVWPQFEDYFSRILTLHDKDGGWYAR